MPDYEKYFGTEMRLNWKETQYLLDKSY